MTSDSGSSSNDDALILSSSSNSGADDDTSSFVASRTPGYVVAGGETVFERCVDLVLGLLFLTTTIIAARRLSLSRQQQLQLLQQSQQQSPQQGGGGGAETTVVTAFYSLIFLTGAFRAVWFLVPATVWQPFYTPTAVKAWHPDHPGWFGCVLSEIVVTTGSLSLFSIFILILVYWADILKKYLQSGSRRSLPMVTFLGLVTTLIGLQVLNLFLFLVGAYTTQGMILFNAIVLAGVSTVCVFEITVFSHRFRTVLKTLGAINEVSTDSQVRRTIWITVTGNLFFFSRAFHETLVAAVLVTYWRVHGSVDRTFSHAWWDTYTIFKYTSEVTILALMLYILQSRFARTSTTQEQAQDQQTNDDKPRPNKDGYTPVGDV